MRSDSRRRGHDAARRRRWDAAGRQALADGRVFYVADRPRKRRLDGRTATRLHVSGFVHTGAGAHGLYPSRDGKFLTSPTAVAGSISVISFATRKLVATWQIPGGGSPDMGGVSANGQGALAVGTLQRRRLRPLDPNRAAAGEDPGRPGPARAVRLAATRAIFARSHRRHAVALEPLPTGNAPDSAYNDHDCRSPSWPTSLGQSPLRRARSRFASSSICSRRV